ncbi:hypothetical protein evm_008255 [Chilo suppressalis]|nr:hypothetical protein evm_008255 [Chilo suppressalis]
MDDNKYGVIEDLLGLTDSDESSSSNNGIFESHQPFVLELHDLVKDEPPSDDRQEDAKVKKLRRKRKAVNKTPSSGSSGSDSESSVPPTAISKEEFYDAHESYHGLAASAAIMQAVPKNGIVLKAIEDQRANPTQQETASKTETTSAVTVTNAADLNHTD